MQMPSIPNHECIHEDQLLGQSRKIAELETRSNFKEQQILDLNRKMDNLSTKMDKIIDGYNDLRMQSKQDDKELELRLKTIETELELQKQTIVDNRARTSQYIAIITVIFVALTFYFNFIH